MKFSPAQKNYFVIEKELLALILALKNFEVYAPPFGSTVKMYTDHHPLKYLNGLTTKNQRLNRWSLFLHSYHLGVSHIKGLIMTLPFAYLDRWQRSFVCFHCIVFLSYSHTQERIFQRKFLFGWGRVTYSISHAMYVLYHAVSMDQTFREDWH